ncbi:MAG: zinc-ribbon domain-containing protein [Clostridia bacterium]|nr:zinc-ribbon domain-containing protein [Clostridia bacterium]
MFCGKCGNQLPDGVAFCPNCGAKVIKEAESEAAATDAVVNAPQSVQPVTNANAVPPVAAPANKATGKLLYTAKRSAFMYKRRFISIPVLIAAILLIVLGIILDGIFFTVLAIVGAVAAVGCILTLVLTFVEASKSRIEFYDNKIVEKGGLFTSHESQSAMTPIIGVSVYQSFNGKIFGYGHLHVDKIGNWDIYSSYIKKPYEVKKFLESLISQTDYDKIGMHIYN